MIGTILSLLPTLASLITSNSANKKYQSEVDKIRQGNTMSPSALAARNLYAENATRGLPGYETMKEDIENTIPETINQSKDFLTGNGVIQLLGSARARADQQLRALNAANEQAHMANMDQYGNFLGGVMVGQENRLQNIDTGLAMNQANANVYNAAAKNNIMGSFADNMAKMSDEDLAKLIGLLSKDRSVKLDLNTGMNYGIGNGFTSSAGPPDAMASLPGLVDLGLSNKII